MRYREGEIRRIARWAVAAARQRGRRVCAVDKANVRVKVQAAAISAGETLTTQQYVTTNPEDTFAIFKVYSGVTSNISGIVYVQLPESMVS